MDDDRITHRTGPQCALELDRALSPFEVVFWRLAQAGSLNVTTIASIEGPLAEDALVGGLRLLQQRHPLLQVRIPAVDGPARFSTRNVPEIPLRVLDRAASDHDAVIEEEINHPIDAARGPLVRCTWIRCDAESHLLLITFHHVIGDGLSGTLMMRDLAQAAAAHLSGDKDPPVALLRDHQPMDFRLPRQARGLRGIWNQFHFLASMTMEDRKLRAPERPGVDRSAPLSARRTRLFCRTLNAATLEKLAGSARAHETTVHGALSSAVVLATVSDNSQTASTSVKHRTPVNMRQLLEPPVADDVGMFASMAFYRGRVCASDDFWSLARDIRTGIKRQVDGGVPAVLVGMLPRLYRLLRAGRLTAEDFAAQWQQRTPSTTGLTNLGRVEISGNFGPLAIRKLHFAVSPGGLGDCAATATTFAGNLHWNFLFASPLFADERALRITNEAVARLEQALDA